MSRLAWREADDQCSRSAASLGRRRQPGSAAGIAEMLNGHGDVCGEAGDGPEAVELARALKPDLVLLGVYCRR